MEELPTSSNVPLAPPPPGAVTNFNDPVDQQHYIQIVATMAVIIPLSTLCVVARVWTRAVVVKQFGLDDVFALLALGLNIGHTVCFAGEIRTGVTDYDWDVRALEWIINDEPRYNYWNAINSILFYYTMTFLKVSILVLYLRVLGPGFRKSRIYIYVIIFVVCAPTVACTVRVLTFCSPVEKLFYPELEGTCNIDLNVIFIQALLSVVTDLFILIPPIPFVWKLSCSVSYKIGLLFVLCLGFVVTGIAITRAVIVAPRYVKQPYFLYGNFQPTYWALLELNMAIIAVCLPALTQLVRRIHRRSSVQSEHSPPAQVSDEVGASPCNGSPVGRDVTSKKKRSTLSQIVNVMVSDLRTRTEEEKGLDSSIYEMEIVASENKKNTSNGQGGADGSATSSAQETI